MIQVPTSGRVKVRQGNGGDTIKQYVFNARTSGWILSSTMWVDILLLALFFSTSFSHIISIEHADDGSIVQRILDPDDPCAMTRYLQLRSDGRDADSIFTSEILEIPTGEASLNSRSIVRRSCRGPIGEAVRRTLREVKRWAAISTLATFFRREGRFDIYNSRVFAHCFPLVGPALRGRVRARFFAVSTEATRSNQGQVSLRCDDPGRCCSNEPNRIAFVSQDTEEIVLVLVADPWQDKYI